MAIVNVVAIAAYRRIYWQCPVSPLNQLIHGFKLFYIDVYIQSNKRD